MWLKCIAVLALIALATAKLPIPAYGEEYIDVEEVEEDEEVEEIEKREWVPPMFPHYDTFKMLWVHRNGSITNYTSDENLTIEIGGSPKASNWAVYSVAKVVAKMTQHMSQVTWDKLARTDQGKSAAATFTREEHLTVFPAYWKWANGDCGSSCAGACHTTCVSGHGRKYYTLAGYGNNPAVVLEDNVICGWHDPYHQALSVINHEYSHNIMSKLGGTMINRIRDAYLHAKSAGLWWAGTYAMKTRQEYWAEATTVFFGTQQYSMSNAGGMSHCYNVKPEQCRDEHDGQANIKRKDPTLYNILNEVYRQGNESLSFNLNICPGPEPDDYVQAKSQYIPPPTTTVKTTIPTTVPTTVSGTSQAPTTQAPTTRAPATQAPTTQAPTTQAPTTQAPTTDGSFTIPVASTTAK